ncbi:helix-turn-helix domain-containing protein [Nocardia nova]|uniref:helix-turn-helix domain-containing protein n=1 Tax=Nocardia nova TaxID=37330 RepID=UPI0037235DB2
MLEAPAGQSNAGIARALAITADTARKWRKRFCGNGIDGLIDLPRSGRPRTFTAEQVAEVKAARALDLYARIWDGEPLGADDYVLSADEKPGVQARHRLRRSLGPAARRPMRVESEYQRGGTLAYFAAYDVHRAHVIGRCEPTTGIEPVRPACRAGHYQRALPQRGGCSGSSTTEPPTATGPQRNDSTTPTRTRTWCTCRPTPPGLTRWRSTSPACNPDLTAVADRLLAFQDHYNATARPFIRLDLHPRRPQRPTAPARPPRPGHAPPACRVTPDELTGAPTSCRPRRSDGLLPRQPSDLPGLCVPKITLFVT